MSYKTIVVHADLSRHASSRIGVAAQLAQAHDAHLVGLAATGVSREVFPHGYPAMPGALEASYFDPLNEAATRALKQFEEICGVEGVAHDSRLLWDLASDALARQARFSDLVIVSQDDPSEALPDRIGRIPEYVALTSARPVLVVPRAPLARQPGQHVLVAWNDSKEASAAVHAAIPLLQRAARVRVVSFGLHDIPDRQDLLWQPDLAAFLARHDIGAEMLAFDQQADCGHALLTMASQQGDDLIVMGCYGHSQFRELFLGGVTRTVLQDARLPILMAR